MDIPRKTKKRSRNIRRGLYIVTAVVVLSAITFGLSKLKPAAPSVDRATVWVDKVKRGDIPRQVRGNGTLVPEDIRWIPSTTDGRVERIVIKPGTQVTPDTVILELSNPDLERQSLDAEMELRASEASLLRLRTELESQYLQQKAAAASMKSDYTQAALKADRNVQLAKLGLVSDIDRQTTTMIAEQLANRVEIEEKRLEMTLAQNKARLAEQHASLEQRKALLQLRREQVGALHVRATIKGVLQQVEVEVGQQIGPGTNLARVADPATLKAELRVPETQAKDIMPGQRTEVDTRNGKVPGRVMRVDPAAQQGTVTVDVALEGEMPKGASPGLSVDGTIELELLAQILYVGRPVQGQENGTISLFKLEDGGKSAVRVTVRLGRTSVNQVEILEGLREGDEVILSDTAQWDNVDRIRLD